MKIEDTEVLGRQN